MKKKLAGVLAALMVLTMGTTVSAAPSSNKESDLEKEAQELEIKVEAGDSSVSLTSSPVSTKDLTSVYEEVAEKIGSNEFQVLAAVEIASKTTLPSGGVSIKFNVSGLASGTKNVRIYHKKDSSSWEIKTPYVGDGYVTATFASLSPFFVVKYNSTPSTSDGSEDQSSSVVNNYYNTYNTYNNTNSNNTTTTNNTNSNNTTTTNNTNSNNTTTTNNTNSNNTSTTNNGKTSSKKTDSSTTDSTSKKTTKKSTTKKSTTDKDTSSSQSASANSTNDNSSKNTQTVTVNVSGGGSSSAKGGASTSTTSPKTGSSLPALPMIAVFLVMGIAVCGKKARNL
jgi:hypothetical protein